jgi:5-bromo-4-chloroindolyl phosphate hydrolysis protein
MKAKALLFYLLGAISLIIAMILFFKWLDWKFLLPLALGIASVAFFWIGSSASKKGKS